MTNHVHLLASADRTEAPGALMKALGCDASSRQAAYRELFRYELEPGVVDEIRKATNGNFLLGDSCFAASVAAALGRRVQPGKPGRPRKVAAPESGELFG